MLRKLMSLFVLSISFTLNAQDELINIEQFVEKIDIEIPQLLNDFSVPGASIAIIKNGEVIIQKAYGFSNIEKKIKLTTETSFNIASISKTITAWGIMRLVQEGKINLDDPAEKHLKKVAFT